MNVLATFQNDLWKFTDVRALTVIFHMRSWKMPKKLFDKFSFWRLWKNPERILINIFRPTYMPNLVTLAWKMSSAKSKEAGSLNYLIISWYLHVRNGVAVAAYSRLASRSQAKFHTMKLSPLHGPCAAAPAQSTTYPNRSLDFRRATSSQRGRWVGSWPLLLRSVHKDTS